MLMNSNYLLRRMAGVYQPPEKKSDVTDVLFKSIINQMGGHQMMMDISRCRLLVPTSFYDFNICTNLQYLDVSYTQIDDLDPITDNCTVLRSLVLAGIEFLSPVTFQPLSKLVSLELLSLRSSNIESSEYLQGLLQLRSLDLGHSGISSIGCLQGLTRMEELCLDHSMLKGEACVPESLHCLSRLKLLRLLNVCGTELEKASASILDVVPPGGFSLEAKSRRLV